MSHNEVFDDIDADLNHFNEMYPGVGNEESCKYYTFSKYKDLELGYRNVISLIHYNIRSIMNKIDELLVELTQLNNCSFSVICFTESWLNESNVDSVRYSRLLSSL